MSRGAFLVFFLLASAGLSAQPDPYCDIHWTSTDSYGLNTAAHAIYWNFWFNHPDESVRVFLGNDIVGPEYAVSETSGYGEVWSTNVLSHSGRALSDGCYRATATADVYVNNAVHEQTASTPQYCVPRVVDSPDDNVVCPGPGCGSPIILQLGIGPYRLTSAADGVTFDLRNEGRRRQVAWIAAGADIAFLAMDRNGNGVIDNGSELFGDSTPLASGHYAENGFAVLVEFDANHDGIVDASDPVWPSLLLWNDRNHDGLSTPDELRPAANAVAALETACHIVGRQDEWGNLFHYMADFRIDPSRERPRKYYDVFLRIDP